MLLLVAGFGLAGVAWWRRSWPLMLLALLIGLLAATLLWLNTEQALRRRGAPAEPDTLVWVTERRVRFHLAGCSLLGNSAEQMPRSEAIAAGMSGCGICGSR